MRMRRIQIALCAVFAFVLSAVLPLQNIANAYFIDTTRNVSLKIHFSVSNSAISGAQFQLYRVADVSSAGQFTLAGDFAEYSVSFGGLDKSGWTNLAKTLSDYASRDGLKPIQNVTTDTNGDAAFSECTTGLYMVTGSKITKGNYTYAPEPTLISLPNANVNGEPEYDVTIEPKADISSYTTSKGGGGGGTSTTQRTVKKVWSGDKNTARPDSVVIQLLRNGDVYSEVTLNSSNDWKYTWTKLSSSYDWSVVEKTVPDGYTVSVSRSGGTFTVTNTLNNTEPDNPGTTPKPGSTSNPSNPGTTHTPGPNKPSDPNNPSSSVNPDNPNDPNNPDSPGNPDNPDNSSNPDNPDNPGNPDSTNSSGTGGKSSGSSEKLPQTGMLWWPVPVMYAAGTGIFFTGYFCRRKNSEVDEDDE